MAAAMARGWAAGEGGPDAMLFCDLDADRAAVLADAVGGETRGALPELSADSDVLLLAVKPSALDDVAHDLDGRAPALISMLAATPLARLDEAFPGVPTLRVMPNQPVEVRRGVICHPPPANAPDELARELLELVGLLGTTVELEEAELNAATVVMSSSPAFFALVAEALAGAGARHGLDAKLSARLVAATLAGTGELLGIHDAATVRRHVAPPGGVTEAGLEALEEKRLREAFEAAVSASMERMP